MVTIFIMSLLIVAFFSGTMGYAAGRDKGYRNCREGHTYPKKKVYVEPPKQQTAWPVTHAQLLDPSEFAQHYGAFNTTTYREYCNEIESVLRGYKNVHYHIVDIQRKNGERERLQLEHEKEQAKLSADIEEQKTRSVKAIAERVKFKPARPEPPARKKKQSPKHLLPIHLAKDQVILKKKIERELIQKHGNTHEEVAEMKDEMDRLIVEYLNNGNVEEDIL